MNRAAFLDRDGVINRKPSEGNYVTSWEGIEFLPGVSRAIALLNRAGFQVVVITNQRCVAKGLITTVALDSIHRRLREESALQGARVDAVYYCPHEVKPPCECRKPAPGLLLAAAREHEIDLTASWMIGDSEIDIDAGKNAQCKTARIGISDIIITKADVIAPSLLSAVCRIIDHDGIRLDSRAAKA